MNENELLKKCENMEMCLSAVANMLHMRAENFDKPELFISELVDALYKNRVDSMLDGVRLVTKLEGEQK